MKKYLLLVSIICSIYSYGQTNNLKLILVNHEDLIGNDSLLKVFQQFIRDINQKTPNFNYSDISYRPIDFMLSPNLVEESTIGSMKAANFIYCNNNLSKQLIPIFIVKKDNQEFPYYTSYFIINKNSNIESLNSPEIKKIYFVDEQSASGFIAPIHQLWESGVISQPSLKSAKKMFGEQNVIKAGGHQAVIQHINKDDELNSIGFCGEVPDSLSHSKILLRYAYLPQDVIFVSQNLKQYIPQIKEWLKNHTKSGIFQNTSTRITGIEDFDLEHQAAYMNLKKIIDRVEYSEKNSGTRKFKFEDLNTPSQLFNFLKELTFEEIGVLIALLVTIFSAGVTVALKYPKILEAIKSTPKG